MQNKTLDSLYETIERKYYIFEGQCSKIIEYHGIFDKQISKNIAAASIQTRPSSSNGVWCCALLPVILVLFNTLYHVPIAYSLTAYISLGLLFNSALFMLFLSISCRVIKENIYGGSLACGILSSLLVYTLLDQNLFISMAITLPPIMALYYLIRFVLKNFPSTFTLGEALIVIQGFILFVSLSIGKLVLTDKVNPDIDIVDTTIYIGLTTVAAGITIMAKLPKESHTSSKLLQVTASVCLLAALVLHIVLGPTILMRLFSYIFDDFNKIKLLLFWLMMVFLAIYLVTVSPTSTKADTVARKSFHIVASLVFIPGILCDVQFMKLASGVALGLLITLEALRKSGIEPYSSALQSAFQVYADEKDAGSFAMTPIYLFVGLACPLVLVPQYGGHQLVLLSGVLSIGVGDTAASWYGSRYGVTKILGTNKTKEGAYANILAQIATVVVLRYLGYLMTASTIATMIRVAFVATISGLVEATTDQVDNLILPLVSIIAFQLTWFLE
ncbi:unnamed protein product [Plutella xylostella]|uniref:dolichol kinase n=1 Tax=Plutella xylostella TaxID=51655 RepID=A0A8S4EN06_PLUXY|nr:unnamed protein product [Plutella xylostella]